MKNTFFSLLALIFVAQIALANVVTGEAAIPDGYYNGVDGKSSANSILDALWNIIKDHNVIAYKSLEPYYEQTDFYGDTVWDMYSTCRFTMDDANKSQSEVCDAWNKEHSIPQSWFNEGSPMKSDLFHVYPTDARVNNFRNNFPYGEVNGPRGTGITNNTGNHALGKKGSNTFSGYSGDVYEPDDEYKGDFARTYFYMCARYRDKTLNASYGSAVFTSNKTNLTEYAKNLFLKWHRQDPVSQKEIDRNQAVYGIQNNRNPFIDYPDLAEYIWGDRVGQTVDLSSMTPTCEGGGSTPVVIIKHGVTWSVNGALIRTDSVKENTKPSALPETPTSCSSESDVFRGWTNAPINGSTDDAPAVLYTKVADIPAITADITLYAVFAKATAGSVTPATYTYNANNTTGWTNTATLTNNSYWLLDQGKTLTSPEVDLAGLSSIEVNMRTYGGTTYCNLDVTANGNPIATIVATAGKTLTDYTWTNTESFSGVASLVFSTNYGASQGIGFTSVTINATGSGATYSRYLTSCSTTDLDNQQSEIKIRKFIREGQLYIEINNQIYNITGQKIH